MIRILLLEDDNDDCEIIIAKLKAGGLMIEVERAQTQWGFERALEKQDWDLVLADYSLPRFDGMAAIEIAHKLRPHVPIILISGVIGEDLAIEALRLGATDYVLKQRVDRLVPVVLRALRESEQRKVVLRQVGDTVAAFDRCLAELEQKIGRQPECAEPLAQLKTLGAQLEQIVEDALSGGAAGGRGEERPVPA